MKLLQFVKAQAKEIKEERGGGGGEGENDDIRLIQVSQGLPGQVRVAFY